MPPKQVGKRRVIGTRHGPTRSSFVAKCEAEADLEEKVIKFPTVAKGGSEKDP